MIPLSLMIIFMKPFHNSALRIRSWDQKMSLIPFFPINSIKQGEPLIDCLDPITEKGDFTNGYDVDQGEDGVPIFIG